MFAKNLPNFFTLLNLSLGLVAIILAIQDMWHYAALLIIISMLLDGLDGRIARMLNVQSEFGKELDSLSDLISFGVAPALIMYLAAFRDLDSVGGILVTAAFPVCGALRLARFNVSSSGLVGYFIGLPIPAAGTILVCLSLLSDHIASRSFFMICMLFLSYLMVSHIKYPAFKKKSVSKLTYVVAVIILSFGIGIAYFYPDELPKLVAAPLILYAVYGIITTRRYNKLNED